MKNVILLIFSIILAIPMSAGTKLVSGNLSEFVGAKAIPVFVNWDNAIYEKSGTLADFLCTALRDKDWETESLEYLLTRANAQIVEYGVRLTKPQETTDFKYKMDVIIQSISKEGTIEGMIYVVSSNQSHPIATIEFKSDDADNNDKVAFRDQFKSIGKSLGKLLTEKFGRADTDKRRSVRDKKFDDPIYN